MKVRSNLAASLVLGFTALLASDSISLGGESDWPQWRGPNRDGYAAPQSLLQQWPAGGPKKKWEFRDAGVGYSAFSIVDGRLYTMGTKDSQCHVICIDAQGGDLLWESPISRAGNDQDYATRWGDGPRSTPTFDQGKLFCLSDVGVLACLDAADGKLIWSVDFVADFGGTIPKWGYSESPLVDGDRVVATPGGKKFMVGLDKATGNEVWVSQDYDELAQYVSPIKHTVGDVTFYASASKAGLAAFDAESGKLLFKNSATGNDTAVIPTPLASEDLLYHTSDYSAGNVLLRLTAGANRTIAAEAVYQLSTKSMQNHHGGVVLVDGVIYGHTKAAWMAQDFQSGDDLWMESTRPNRSGSTAFADGRLYFYNDEEGSIYLVEPNRKSLQKRGELKLPEKTKIERGQGAIWAHPVIADQTLFLRDQDLIFAFDIAR